MRFIRVIVTQTIPELNETINAKIKTTFVEGVCQKKSTILQGKSI